MSLEMIDAVYSVLKKDAEFMALLGLMPSSPATDIVKRIVKGMEPEQAVTNSTVPMACLYVKPGRFGRNHLVYEGKFCLDFYGKTAYQAKQLAARCEELLHNQQIDEGGFHSFLCTLAYDADFATGITGVKGYESIYDLDFLR